MQSYDIGNRIYELRKEKNLSQKELGALLGVSNKAVSKWETGAAIPKTETLIKLASVLGVSSEELLSGKCEDAQMLDSLEALSAQSENILLKKKISSYETEGYKKAKTYLICVFSLFFTFSILYLILYFAGNISLPWFDSTVAPDTSLEDGILLSFGMGYAVSGIYTGITIFSNLSKKSPAWVTVLLCVFFFITIMLIELAGIFMVIPKIIKSAGILLEKRSENNG